MSSKYPFKLCFDKKAIQKWAEQYPRDYDRELETVIAPPVKARGYFLHACPLIDKLY